MRNSREHVPLKPPASADTKEPGPPSPLSHLPPFQSWKGRESSMYLGLSVSSLIPHLLSTSEFPEVSGDLKFNN